MQNFMNNAYNTNKNTMSKPNNPGITPNRLGRRNEEEISQDMLKQSNQFMTDQRKLIQKNEEEKEAKRRELAESMATYSKKPAGQPISTGTNTTQVQKDLMRNLNRPKF